MKISFFSAVCYDSIIGGRTKRLALEIARLGHDVWFVEMPGLRNMRIPPMQIRKADGISIVTLPPFPGSHKLMETCLGAVWRKAVRFFLSERLAPIEDIHCIVSTPWWTNLVRGVPFKSLTYDFIDNVSVHCSRKYEKTMRRWEESLLGRSQSIFIVRDTLRNEIKNTETKNTSLISNGVPESWLKIQPIRSTRGERPRIGFIGSIYEWVDQELICYAAETLSDLDFILIGPLRREVTVDAMRKVPNVLLNPPVPFEQVPKCIQSFDVCIIPFKRDVVSRYADPLKLYEYLALGKPVVCSVDFNPHAPVYAGTTPREFAVHIESALDEPDRSAEYREFASHYTWRKQARKVIEALGPRGSKNVEAEGAILATS
ncbi:MAG: glycosyltransferase [Phycisphaerales bacterium]|nr:MAG: glycosyltransferase [Phycisphaerales bacterium]